MTFHPPFRDALLLAALLLAAHAASAQDRPSLTPTRDVDIIYRTERAGQVIEQRSRFDAALQRTRLDMPTPGLYSILDHRAHTLSIVSDPERGVIDMPSGATGQAGAGAYARRGQDQVAGLACTEWETLDSQKQAVLTCFTPDGVMLRARRGAAVLAVATRVTYGPLDPVLFTAPAGYGHVTRRAAP